MWFALTFVLNGFCNWLNFVRWEKSMIEVNHIVLSCMPAVVQISLKHVKPILKEKWERLNKIRRLFHLKTGNDFFHLVFFFLVRSQVIEGKHSVYRMSAATEEDKQEWIKCLNASISHNPFYDILTQRKKKALTVS